MGCVLGVAASVVEEEADVMSPEHIDHALVLGTVLENGPELVAAGTERGTRGVFKRSNVSIGFETGIDQVLCQDADDAVPSGIDLADLIRMPARSLQHAAGRGVDHRGYAARLGIESVRGSHDTSLSRISKPRRHHGHIPVALRIERAV